VLKWGYVLLHVVENLICTRSYMWRSFCSLIKFIVGCDRCFLVLQMSSFISVVYFVHFIMCLLVWRHLVIATLGNYWLIIWYCYELTALIVCLHETMLNYPYNTYIVLRLDWVTMQLWTDFKLGSNFGIPSHLFIFLFCDMQISGLVL